MNGKNKKHVLVFVHDAGGAEVIGAWMRTHKAHYRFLAFGSGPSALVFRRHHLPLTKVADDKAAIERLIQTHAQEAAFVLVAAPGWMTDIERNALRIAKRAGLPTVAYVDSWIDPRTRFKRDIPDTFWVGDTKALQQYRKAFARVRVRLVPNEYFREQVRSFRRRKRPSPARREILFLSSPGRLSERLLAALLGRIGAQRLVVRLHPSESRRRYGPLLRQHSLVRCRISTEELIEDISKSDVALGSQTMALAIASLCGIRCVNFVPPHETPLPPFSAVSVARTAREAVKKTLT